MSPSDYSIAEVSALTGTPVRTIRYYIAEGLLPSAGQVGPAARYDEAFVARLRAIRRLQERHQPLAAIRTALEGMSDEAVIAAVQPSEEPPPDSASDYVRRILGAGGAAPAQDLRTDWLGLQSGDWTARPSAVLPAMSAPAPFPAAAAPSGAPGAPPAPGLLVSDAWDAPDVAEGRALYASIQPALPPEAGRPAGGERSHWERISISPDVEIHVRRPASRRSVKRVQLLVEFARQVFEEGAT
jgi:DNA-binding transcriptional MerR regulator